MNKMKILNGIIEENIDYFWNNDSIVSYETDTMKLWDAFKVWCVQNCLEVLDGVEESIVDKAIDQNYNNWLDKKIF